jgi:hypothetical protein
MVWTGTELGLVWTESRAGRDQAYFTRMSGDGVRWMPNVPLPTRGVGQPALAWTGESWVVAGNGEEDDGTFGTYLMSFSVCP